jgi:hypothetical protein
MNVLAQVPNKPLPWQVTIGAEGIAAAQFARCGFDVSVQSGRDKPTYDLVVAKSGNLLKVSVKGSDDGSWALTEPYLKRVTDMHGQRANFLGAIAQWQDHQGSRAVCCLVQFRDVSIDELPRIYLASPEEIAQKLREAVDRLGISTLFEKYAWTPAGEEYATTEELPSAWAFSESRIDELLFKASAPAPKPTLLTRVKSPAGDWIAGVESRGSGEPAIGLSA